MTDRSRIEVVYTDMAMDAPTRRVEHTCPPGKLALLRAVAPPVSFYRYLYNHVGEQWFWIERRQLEDDELAALIADERLEIPVLYVDGVPAGFAELDARTQISDAVVRLTHIGLVPEFLGRGYGRYLLRCTLNAAWAREPTEVSTRTSTLDHPRASTMLQRAGFVAQSQRQLWIDDPRASGLIDAAIVLPSHHGVQVSTAPSGRPSATVTQLHPSSPSPVD
jgi:GNAT superfamily N-acetyltransferase